MGGKIIIWKMAGRTRTIATLPDRKGLQSKIRYVLPALDETTAQGERDRDIFHRLTKEVAAEVLKYIKGAGEVSEDTIAWIMDNACTKHGITRDEFITIVSIAHMEAEVAAEEHTANAAILKAIAEQAFEFMPREPSQEKVEAFHDIFAQVAAFPIKEGQLHIEEGAIAQLLSAIQEKMGVEEAAARVIFSGIGRLFRADFPNMRQLLWNLLDPAERTALDMLAKGKDVELHNIGEILTPDEYFYEGHPSRFKSEKEQEARTLLIRDLIAKKAFGRLFMQVLDMLTRQMVSEHGWYENAAE